MSIPTLNHGHVISYFDTAVLVIVLICGSKTTVETIHGLISLILSKISVLLFLQALAISSTSYHAPPKH